MNWLHAQMALLDAATATVDFGVNWFLQSTVLITIGLATGRLLRRRGSAVQSAVYRTTLAAVLICPIASWLLSLAGVSGWSIAMPQPWTYEQTKTIIADAALPVLEPPSASLESVVDAASPARLVDASDKLGQQSLPEALPGDVSALQSIGPVNGDIPSPVTGEQSIQEPAAPSGEIWTFSVHAYGWLALGIDGTWLLISTALLARLATAWWRLSGLCRGAAQADAVTRRTCHELAAQLAVAAPVVLRSPYLPSPCLAGLRRPAVLLPEAELSLSVRDVLIHELAHLARRDCHWNLLRQLALSAFFFQPLLWKLSRRLETTAEEVCDDYVVEYGGDRQEYAHRLVDIAELSTAPMAAAGVGIVSLRSMLAKRVQRIMDTSRSLSTRVGSLLLTLVLVGGLIGTTIVALVGIGPQQSVAEVASQPGETKATDDDQGAEDDAAADTKVRDVDENSITVGGYVVDPTGKPVAGAVVRSVPAELEDGPWERMAPPKTVETDAAGRFQVTFDMTQAALADWPRFWPLAMTVASAPGLGPAWTLNMPGDARQEMKLRLVADQAIEGRVVGLEGQPIAGVRAQAISIETNEKEDLTEWLDALRGGASLRDAEKVRAPLRRLGNAPPQWSTGRNLVGIHATTGADGRFRMAGVGRGRMVYIELSGAEIVTSHVWVLAGAMEPVKVNVSDRTYPNELTYLGTPFQFVAEQSQPIEGVVRDAKSGQQLSGVRVMSVQFARSRLGGNHLVKTISDDQGRYRLVGMPQGKGNRILVMPGDDQPYFMREFDVPASESFDPVKLDIDLHRGVWIAGRVTEHATGHGARGRMFYIPWPDNPAAEGLREFNYGNLPGPQDRYRTDADGHYRLVGLPGRGLVEFCHTDVRRPFPNGQGVGQIADLPPDEVFKKISNLATPRAPFVTAIKEVRAENADSQVTADIVLDEGHSIAVKLIDPSGQPLSGVTARGLWPVFQHYDAENRGPTVEVTALANDEERILMLEHPGRKLGKWLKVNAAEHGAGPATVTLEPCATVKGRLLDKDGEPVAGATMRFFYPAGPNFINPLTDVITDTDGQFMHSAVPSGCKYQIQCESRRVGLKTVIKELAVAVGETVDLGEFDVTKEERPEPKRTAAAQKTAAANDAAPVQVDTNQQTAAGDASDRLEFAGKVVDPNKKPMAGAKIYLLYYTPNNVDTRPLGQTDASGAFDFAVSKRDFDTGEMNDPWQAAYLVAVANGFGLEAASAASFEKSGALLAKMREKPNFSEEFANLVVDRTLRLVADDVPIEGRILNLEGQPVAGATAQVMEIHLNRENTLDPWLNAVENEKADFYQARMHVMHGFHGRHLSGQVSQLFPKVVTGPDGRFRIDGIGHERIVLMQIQGPGIETREVYSRTRPGAALRVIEERRDPDGGSYTYYPATFDFPAAPSRPVIGVVRDVDSGKPLAGVAIQAQRIAGERTSGWRNFYIHAKTDAEGRYRLEGLPIGENEVMAVPKGEEPYLIASLSVETTPAQDATTLDFKLQRGVWIRGRVTDSATEKPLRARVEYFAFRENPNAKAAPGLMRAPAPFRTTDAAGRFAVPGLPGRGLVAVMADNHEDYPRGAGAEHIKGGRADDQGMILNTSPYRAVASNFHHLVEVNPASDADAVECSIALRAGAARKGTVLDSDGKPLAGAMFAGENEFMYFHPLGGATFSVRNLQPDKPRRIQFFHKPRKLAGSALITPDESGPISVKLEPWGVITGRVLDENGSPADKVTIGSGLYDRPKNGQVGVLLEPNPLQTDDNGRFRIEGLAPGVDYSLSATKGSRYLGIVIGTFQISADETKDLGDLTIHQAPDQSNNKPATKNNVSQDAAKDDVGDRINFAGKVVNAAGKPVRGAKIFMIRLDYTALGAATLKPLAETNADGTFTFTAAGKEFDPREGRNHWRFTPLVATAEGHAMVWAMAAGFESSGGLLKELRADPDFSESDAHLATDKTLRLLADDMPIEGRIVNLEGLPVVAAKVKVIEIRAHRTNKLDSWLEVARAQSDTSSSNLWNGFDILDLSEQVRQLFPEAVTNADGRFQIRGVGHERIVRLQIEAPQIETRRVYVRTQQGPTIQVADNRFEPKYGVKTYYGASFEHPVGPSRPVAGVVRDVDTHMPLAGVTIQIDQMAGDPGQGWPKESLRTTTDAEGHYRVTGLPIGENSLMALAPFDQPYLLAVQQCDTGQVKESLQLDFNLKRGVWVRGRVTDGDTGQGVRADVEYYAPLDNPHQKATPSFWGANWRPHLTDSDGRFAIPAFAGRGLIAVRAHDYRAYPRGVGADKIAGGKYEDGVTSIVFRTNPLILTANDHSAIKDINPSEGVDASDIDFSLKSGKSLSGAVLDPEGKPLAGATFSGEVEQTSIWKPLKESSFAVRNLQLDKARRLLFVHEQRQLAGSVLLTGEESGPLRVRLESWGAVSGRALDKTGEPLRAVYLVPFFKVGNEWHIGAQPRDRLQRTDDEGRFAVDGLAPGVEYLFRVMPSTGDRYIGVVGEDVKVSSGEVKDLGDLTIRQSPDPSTKKPAAKNNVSQAAAKVNVGDRLNFAGKVVDSAGRPVRGARIFMMRFDGIALSAIPLKPLAETQADGTFEFTAAAEDYYPLDAYIHWGFTPLLATAEGYALAWSPAASFELSGAVLKELRADPKFSEQDSTLAADRTLRLPDDDLPIEGRIVNLEGLPIAAARVKVIEIQCFPRMSLDAWIKLAQSKISSKSPELWRGIEALNLGEQVRQLFPEVATDADGRFRIDGIGRERMVRLQIEAPAIETRRVYVRTQRGGAIKVGDGSGGLNSGDKTIFAASFEFPIGPSRPVTGVVRDVDTQKPLSGVTIQIHHMAGDPNHVWPKESLRTTSDAEGRYRVTGLPIGENSLMALAPLDQPYMLAVQECDTGSVKESLQLDFNLKRGVWVRGRVTDASTGQGVRASVEYYAMLDNPYQKAAPNFWGAYWRPHLTDADGRFAIPAFAGRGLIAVRAHDYRTYPRGVGADKIAGGKYEVGVTSITFPTNPTSFRANDHSAIKEINPSEGVDVSDLDFILKSGRSLAGTVLDPEGKPLAGAKFSGEVEQTGIWKPLKESSFAVRNVQPGKARLLLFVHEQRQLAGSVLLTGEESGPLSAKLEPWGAIRGRALDKSGEPLRGVHLVPFFKVENEWQYGGHTTESSTVDDEGRFTIAGLVPGVEYMFRVLASKRDRYIGVVGEDIKVSPGETKDLGDVTLSTSK